MKFFILSLLLSLQIFAAEGVNRWIDLEWDEVKGASGYEIALFEIIDEKEFARGVFKIDTAHWSKEVPSGKYAVKIRALDNRKVPGNWGESIPVTIKLPPTQLIRPLLKETLTFPDLGDLEVAFQWTAVNGASNYQLIIWNSQKQNIVNKTTKEIELKIELSKIDQYFWAVIPMFDKEDEKNPDEMIANTEDKALIKTFIIKGAQLKSPEVTTEIVPNKGIVFRWKEVFRSDEYNIEVLKEDENKKLISIINQKTDKKHFALAKDKVPPGRYFFIIKALSKEYQESVPSRILFQTDTGLLEIVNNESINKDLTTRPLELNSIETQFGYPNFTYSNKNYENDSLNEQNLRGVQLFSKWRHTIAKSRLQNLVKLEIAQVANSSAEGMFFSIADNFGKSYPIKNAQVYLSAGARLESTPVISTDRYTLTVQSESIMTINPDFRAEYKTKFDDHWGMDFNLNINIPLFAISSPGESKLGMTFSTDIELRGIYSINRNFDIYSAIFNKSHHIKYKPKTGGTSRATESDMDEIKFQSTYLVFGAEFFF